MALLFLRWAGCAGAVRARRRVSLLAALAACGVASVAAADVFMVTNTADAGEGSLREAIQQASIAGGDIHFAIPTTDPNYNLPGSPGAWRIGLETSLPDLSNGVRIDALTQPGATCEAPLVEIRPVGDPFSGDGIDITGSGCLVRGLVINGFPGAGVLIKGGNGNAIECNIIGLGVGATPATGNASGVHILLGENNTIGGLGAGAANIIAGNADDGVRITASGSNHGNFIFANSVYANGGLGIDLGDDGPTPNDPLDSDAGPNHLQNFPVIESFDEGVITATLNSLPDRRFRIEFFASPEPDPSGHGEGQVFIGAVDAMTNLAGFATVTMPFSPGANDLVLSATATAMPIGRGVAPPPHTGTSEFGPAYSITPGGNTPPTAESATVSTPEDVEVVITLAAADADNDALTRRVISLPAGGSLLRFGSLAPIAAGETVADADGRVVYRPPADANGFPLASFDFVASDGQADSAPATITINVIPVNDPPVAAADGYSTNEDATLVVNAAAGVLANDLDVDSPSLSAQVVDGPAHGVLTLNGDGSLTYIPEANFHGTDGFTYRAFDGDLHSEIVGVSLTVNPVNDPPLAGDDAYQVAEDGVLTLDAPGGILQNDSDIDGDALRAEVVSQPSHGTLTLLEDGSFTYTPLADYAGPDEFTYRALDAEASSNIARVNLMVTPVNDAPVAVNDMYTVAEDTVLNVAAASGVLSNDVDIDSPPSSFSAALETLPASGVLAFNPDGSFTFTPEPEFNGTVTFTYRVSDGEAASTPARVTIVVSEVNDPPVANDDTYTVSEDDELLTPAPGLLMNDVDIDHSPVTLAVTIVTPPAHGTLTDVDGGGFRYTPAPDFAGPDSFTYSVEDSDGGVSNIATVHLTVLPVNDAPVALADTFQTFEDTHLVVPVPGVLDNDVDIDLPPDALSVELVSAPADIDLVLNPDGSFTFTPAQDAFGTVMFTYRVFDGHAYSPAATVTVEIAPVNDPPTAMADAYTAFSGVPLMVDAPGVLMNDSDIDSPTLGAQVVVQPARGMLTLNADGSFTYTAETGYAGPDGFVYRVDDGDGGQSGDTAVMIDVRGQMLPPVARCRDITIDARQTCPQGFTIGPADVDNGSSDPDDDVATLTFTLSNHGPFPIGSTVVTLTVTDPTGLSSMCTATVTVLGEDCNGNGVPDACDIAMGAADCNRDGVPDECDCLWDNGAPAADGSGGGLLSQIGGSIQAARRVADDFYLRPGQVCHITSFTGYVLTNTLPELRKARLAFFADCDGSPAGEPFAEYTHSIVMNAVPVSDGFFLVTYTFDLCTADLWLDGGRTYWVSLTGVHTCSDQSESFWAFAEAPAIKASTPRAGDGTPDGTECLDVDFGPFSAADACCGGCRNMAFKLSGHCCPVIWDGGSIAYAAEPGGLPSGRNAQQVARAMDNFVVRPCGDVDVCFIETAVWTNCDPATGFVEIYANECDEPAARLLVAGVSSVVDTEQEIEIEGVRYRGYLLRFFDLDWTLEGGRTYWLSSGATGGGPGGSLNQRSFFAFGGRCDHPCDVQISPARFTVISPPDGSGWQEAGLDLAFRIAAHPPQPAAEPPPATTPACAADVDGSGQITVQDLFTFLYHYFSGCP